MSRLLKNMNRKRKSKCPECKGKLTEFGVNVDEGTIECLSCHAQFSPIQVLQDSDIVFSSESLPADKQKAFLTGLGFEKKPVHRTPKSLLYGFLFFLMLGTTFLSVMLALSGYRITSLSPIVGGLLLCYGIYRNYKDEEVSRWRR